MINYSKAVIYKITTPNGLYVGSTSDFKTRKYGHKNSIYNENSTNYNCKLYQNIRENDGDWNMEILHLFPCENGIELRQEEERVMTELNANLNTHRAYLTEEENMEYKKQYYEKNRDVIRACAKQYNEKHREKISAYMKLRYENNRDKLRAKQREKITCECGCESARDNMPRHRRTKKHLNLMKNKIGM